MTSVQIFVNLIFLCFCLLHLLQRWAENIKLFCRNSTCNNCGSRDCSCGDVQTPGITNNFSGLHLLPGSKRKSVADNNRHNEGTPESLVNLSNLVCMMRPKGVKHDSVPTYFGCWDSDLDMGVVDGSIDSHAEMNRYDSRACVDTTSVCAVEDSLSKGFEGHLSIGCYE